MELSTLDTTKLTQGYQEKLKLIKQELNLSEGIGQINYTKIEECTKKEEANRL